ncbi:DUF3157 family protein [Flaviramulus sp. BrNp1-15]|uniref:DUF3157 family protein n=1 Tax=Flaviramulus sp. BrNp1-15 TaxID=2916754 RepID=UPI001EE947E8|nr:DUF3157 family protein [Flaviramulus sp. BrNp1-15]ULC59898.1 DUF3157 family protein [Flaviramulus sp. BrNp1-15]
MKMPFFIIFFTISSFCFAQNNHIVKTEDGRRVLLKADFTWEYIDAESTTIKEVTKPTESDNCNLAEDFKEPTLDKKIQNQLKKGRATITHIKKRVAKDYNCSVDDVILLSASEKKSNGVYNFCANGKAVKYKRVGNNIIKSRKLF